MNQFLIFNFQFLRECILSMQEGRGRRILQIFPKKFRIPGDIDLNISWPSNFFRKYFMAPPINFSFLFMAYLQQYFRVVFTVIFKFQITKEVNIHNNIQKKYSNKVSKKPLIFFAISKFFYNNKMRFQENLSSALQQSIN